MHVKQTIAATENYLNEMGKSICDTWSLPEVDFNKDLLLEAIMLTGSEFEPLIYDPEIYRMKCAVWFNLHNRTFYKWFKAFELEYDPLVNYDRYEEAHDITKADGTTAVGTTSETKNAGTTTDTYNETDVGSSNSSSQVDGTSKTTNNTTGSDITATDKKQQTVQNNISAFDSSNYQPKDQTITADNAYGVTKTVTNEDITNGETSETGSSSNTTQDKKDSKNVNSVDTKTNTTANTDGETHDNTDYTHTAHLKGNIGVTTSQQMLQSELDVQKFNCYFKMADIFVDEMCVCVY